MSNLHHQRDNAMTAMSAMIRDNRVSRRVSQWLETGDGYPESFTADEMEAVYAYARVGRLCWFIEAQQASEAGSSVFDGDEGGEQAQESPR